LNGDLFYQKFKNYINRASDIAVRDTTRACDPTNSTFTRNFTSRPDPTGVLPNTYADTPQGIAAAGLDPRNCVANAQGLTFNGDAVVKGAEMQIDFRATPRLRLGLNAAYTKAEYVDAFAPCSDPDGNGIAGNQSPLNLPRQVATGQSAQLCDRDGTRLSATTPPWSATFTGEYTQPLLGMEWYGRVIYQYKPSTRNTETDRPIEDVNLVNLYTGFRPEAGDWEVQLFVKNALDEVAKTTGIAQILTGVGNEPTGYGSVNYTPGREIGVSLRYAFSG
jgi:iron complex outermembrane receptor protein